MIHYMMRGVAYYNNVVNVGINAELMQVDGVIHAYLMLENLCTEECNKTYRKSINSLIIKRVNYGSPNHNEP